MSGQSPMSQAEILIALLDLEEVFVAPDGEAAYATITVDDHRETWAVRSSRFKRWLARKFFAIEHKPPSSQALADALLLIEARAQFGSMSHPLCLRVGQLGDTIYLDLCN